ncbi:MAG: hypothetical protein ACSHX5_00440 [Phycisphaerales bacterium]
MTPQTPPSQSSSPTTKEHTVLLEDLTAGLIWPTLLKVPSMAFSPPRWLLGTIAAFLIVLVTSAHSALLSPTPTPQPNLYNHSGITQIVDAMMSLNPLSILTALTHAAQSQAYHISQTPWTSLTLIIPTLLVLGIFGHAITRSASIEFALGRQTDTSSALSASLRAIRQIALATLGPLLIASLLAVVIMLIGLTLGLPVVNILGAILYILGLVLAVLLVCILVLHTLALPITISALAIEGTDGFDALQRAYAYLIAKPIRLALYALILLVLGTTITSIITITAGWSIQLADSLATTLTNDAGRRVIAGTSEMSATEPYAHSIIQLARSALELIVAGYVLSLIFTSSTMAYLCIRRVCDGQDITEVWDPEL